MCLARMVEQMNTRATAALWNEGLRREAVAEIPVIDISPFSPSMSSLKGLTQPAAPRHRLPRRGVKKGLSDGRHGYDDQRWCSRRQNFGQSVVGRSRKMMVRRNDVLVSEQPLDELERSLHQLGLLER